MAALDTKSGPAAVVRNMVQMFGEQVAPHMRLVVVDRFYTSVPLAMLLYMGYYLVGMIHMSRLCFCKAIVVKRNKRPDRISRGE